MKSQNRFFLPALGWFIFSTFLLTLPASAFPTDKWYVKIPLFDKWAHIGVFSIMAFLFCRGIYKKENSFVKRRRYFILTGIICFCYGIIMEFIQGYLIPNRFFDMGDIISDAVGSAAGVVYSFRRYLKR